MPAAAALVAGGAGPLGAAVLEQALAAAAWTPVTALVTRPIEVALDGLDVVAVTPALEQDPPPLRRPHATALVVFDRERSLHGREAAFWRPQPAQLPQLAAWLKAAGVRHLVVVLPHAPALLPQALKAGLASLDEQAVVAIGFDHVVFVRPSRAVAGADRGAAGGRLQALAHALLAQLHWMIPQRDQPLRAAKVAQFVVELARALPAAPPGTRVASPELLWDWAQPDGGERLMDAWLHGAAALAQPPGR